MAHRTTLLLDDQSRQAARELAMNYGCSTSEAIRRAIVRQRDAVLGLVSEKRNLRRQKLDRLFDLFADNDADEEIRRLKQEDEGF